jgi:hypothetical protein
MLQRQDLEVNNKQLLNEMQRLRNALEQVNWAPGPVGQQQAATQWDVAEPQRFRAGKLEQVYFTWSSIISGPLLTSSGSAML